MWRQGNPCPITTSLPFCMLPAHFPFIYSLQQPHVQQKLHRIFLLLHFSMSDHSINYSVCLIGIMDRLWFHQIILFSSESSSPPQIVPKTQKKPHSTTPSSSCLSLPIPEDGILSSQEPLPYFELEISSGSSSNSSLDVSNNEEELERRTRANHTKRRTRSHSSSPSTQKRPEKIKHSSSAGKQVLLKSMSCRTLGELELEEVKGFMDLGFTFKTEQISPRMMSVVPGLQRLGVVHNKKQITNTVKYDDEVTEEQEQEQKAVIRPYLSEAWLIRKPDSPLLNLRIPRATAAADMKRHLRFWARTVASVVVQES